MVAAKQAVKRMIKKPAGEKISHGLFYFAISIPTPGLYRHWYWDCSGNS
jgi:hypothetical protein